MVAKMLISRKLGTVVAVALGVGIFVYALTRAKFRLQSEMPPEFVDVPKSWPEEKRKSEVDVARAYWNCAVTVIQSEYDLGRPLPPNPPPEFKIMMPNQRESAVDPEARRRYWQKLEQFWYLPNYWRKNSNWSLHWMTDPLKSAARWLNEQVEKLSQI